MCRIYIVYRINPKFPILLWVKQQRNTICTQILQMMELEHATMYSLEEKEQLPSHIYSDPQGIPCINVT
jgi:hypothetical protein